LDKFIKRKGDKKDGEETQNIWHWFNTNKIRSLGWKNQHSSLEAIQLSLESLLDENNT
jgi:hypothetical protein